MLNRALRNKFSSSSKFLFENLNNSMNGSTWIFTKNVHYVANCLLLLYNIFLFFFLTKCDNEETLFFQFCF